MLLTAFGTPSALSYATLNIMRNIVEATQGAHSLVQAAFLTDLKSAWTGLDRSARRSVVFFSDCPHPDLLNVMVGTRAPIIVVADEIDEVVGYVMETRGMELPHALRFAIQVTSALDGLFHSIQALRVTPDGYKKNIDGFVAEIVEFFGIECSASQFDAILARLHADSKPRSITLRDYVDRLLPVVRQARIRLQRLSDEQQEILRGLSRQYASIIKGKSLPAVSWPSRMFMDWDRLGSFLERPVDLIGPARFIICGPYFHLPAGSWRVETHIEVRECLSDNAIGVDVFSGEILCAVSMKLPAEGAYAFDMSFETTDPFLPVELRFQLLRGAIEGELRLLDVRLTRSHPDDRQWPETAQALTSV